jgi:hypothetical protein
LDNLLEEYYNLDCEDVIGGGGSKLKTRFKYTSVPKEDYGITEEEIYLLDDAQLNKMVNIKLLKPYRNIDENGNRIEEKMPNKYRI